MARTRVLLSVTTAHALRRAVARGTVVRDGRGHYALPTADRDRRAAAGLDGVVAGLSAAVAWGWEVKWPPARPVVVVPAHRRVDPRRRTGVALRWRDLDPDDVRSGVLRPVATVLDCARTLAFDEALAVADSALRHEAVTRDQLLFHAALVPRTGRSRCLRVAELADGRAANPFESVLRAIALGVRGIDLEPQVAIEEPGWSGRPDLVDQRRRLVVEADSFEFHGRRRALVRDCERYNALVLHGWTVLRFSWEHVMLDPDYVRRSLTALVEQEARPRRRRTGSAGRELPVRA